MFSKWYLSLIIIFFAACQSATHNADHPLEKLPEGPIAFFTFPDYPNALSTLEHEQTPKLKLVQELTSFVKVCDSLFTDKVLNEAFIALYPLGKSSTGYVLVGDAYKAIALEKKGEEKSYNGLVYRQISIANQLYYLFKREQKLFLSTSQIILENIIRTDKKVIRTEPLSRLFNNNIESKIPALLINLEQNHEFTRFFSTWNHQLSAAHWINLPLTIEEDKFSSHGIGIDTDSTTTLLRLLSGTGSIPIKVHDLMPPTITKLNCLTLNDFETYKNHLKRKKPDWNLTEISLTLVEEICMVSYNNQRVGAISSSNSNELSNFLTNKTEPDEDYLQTEIRKVTQQKEIIQLLKPTGYSDIPNYCVLLGNTLIVAQTKDALYTLISNQINEITLSEGQLYQSIKNQMTSNASLWFMSLGTEVANPQDFTKEYQDKLKEKSILFQAVEEGDFMHVNLSITTMAKNNNGIKVSPKLNVVLNDQVVKEPQLLKNHKTNRLEIAVQDASNILYLIDDKGKILWQKPLNGPIKGKIEQVDLYKNGKLQMAFCTDKEFLILDRNGQEVPPFNKEYKDGHLLPLAVFDYEGKRDYRFVVVQKNKIFMYDNKGEIVKGFTFKTDAKSIISAPSHLRISGKDFLVFIEEGGKIRILDRTGKDRIETKENILLAKGQSKVYKNKISLISKAGVLHQWGINGDKSASVLSNEPITGWDATTKSLVYMAANQMNIKGKEIALDFGYFTAPKIFYLQDKLYFTTTNTETQKVFLFDSQGQPLPHFPILGYGGVDIGDMDNDGILELITQSTSNTLTVYNFRP